MLSEENGAIKGREFVFGCVVYREEMVKEMEGWREEIKEVGVELEKINYSW